MTDRAELPARLRDMKVLRSTVNGKTDYDSISAYVQEACAIRHEAAERIEVPEAALKPFAIAADDMDDEPNERADIWERSAGLSITVGDLRRARALSQTSKPEGETR